VTQLLGRLDTRDIAGVEDVLPVMGKKRRDLFVSPTNVMPGALSGQAVVSHLPTIGTDVIGHQKTRAVNLTVLRWSRHAGVISTSSTDATGDRASTHQLNPVIAGILNREDTSNVTRRIVKDDRSDHRPAGAST